ncbi:MAG TPA: nucleotidyl transferase AbiEii/AbiGii toxin family protein [Polyangiaceae bacterium]|nr:nucleotidyl transferase AbiEii/AbiGii toxin family protein [Polyangiaceae bacterium]
MKTFDLTRSFERAAARFGASTRSPSVTETLATQLHAILDRGTRRDFFDLYVSMQTHHQGIVECLAAMREVYGAELHEASLLGALSRLDDAEREAALPGEGPGDWSAVKDFFFGSRGTAAGAAHEAAGDSKTRGRCAFRGGGWAEETTPMS